MAELIKDLEILDNTEEQTVDYRVSAEENIPGQKKLYIETYGCQMNFSDSEIVMAVMQQNGYSSTSSMEDADLIFLNTCSIRENAEQKVRFRLDRLQLL